MSKKILDLARDQQDEVARENGDGQHGWSEEDEVGPWVAASEERGGTYDVAGQISTGGRREAGLV